MPKQNRNIFQLRSFVSNFVTLIQIDFPTCSRLAMREVFAPYRAFVFLFSQTTYIRPDWYTQSSSRTSPLSRENALKHKIPFRAILHMSFPYFYYFGTMRCERYWIELCSGAPSPVLSLLYRCGTYRQFVWAMHGVTMDNFAFFCVELSAVICMMWSQ